MRKFIFVSVLGLSVFGACKGGEKKENTEAAPAATWSGSMQGLQKSLAELEPYLFDSQRFALPGNQEFISKKISELAEGASHVKHDPTLKHRDPTVQFVAAKFSTHLRRAGTHFKEGRTSFARYEIIKVTQFCVECHTRMQGGPEFQLGKVESFQTQMPVLDRAEYLIASRKFDAAYDLLIQKLKGARASDPEPWKLDRVAKMALQISVQYRQEAKKADRVLETIRSNPGLPYFLAEKAKDWAKSLKKWKLEAGKPMKVADIQTLLYQRDSDLDAMRAIPEILKKLQTGPQGTEAAELMFLAGEAYRAVNEVSTLELSENYFEACIHSAPKTSVSKKCFKAMEASIKEGYTGTRGTFMPADVLEDLEKLRSEAE